NRARLELRQERRGACIREKARDSLAGLAAAAEPHSQCGRGAPPAEREIEDGVVVVRARAGDGDDGAGSGGRSEEQHRRAQEVAEPHGSPASAARTAVTPWGPSTTTSARSTIAGGPSS